LRAIIQIAGDYYRLDYVFEVI